MSIFERINAVMKDVKYVQRDSKVTGGGVNYKAVSNEQLLSVVREAMVKYGIIVYPEQTGQEMLITRNPEAGVKMHLYSGNYLVHFVSVDGGDDRVSIPINAHADDSGSKAPAKCVTNATKAAMLKMFALESGDDEESRADYREGIGDEAAGEIKALLSSTGSDTAAFLKMMGAPTVEEINRASLGRALSLLHKKEQQVQAAVEAENATAD